MVIFICSARHEPCSPPTGRFALLQRRFAAEERRPGHPGGDTRQAQMRVHVIATGLSKLIQRLMLKAIAFIMAWKSALSFRRSRLRL